MTRYKTWLVFLVCFTLGLVLSLLLQRLGASRRGAAVSAAPLAAPFVPPAPPRRIVCMTPSVTESVFALDCGDRVVGVSDFCLYPPETARKSRLGGAFNPNFERLLALSPDLLIVQGVSDKLVEFCRRRHIALLQVQMSDIPTIQLDLVRIGHALGCTARALTLSADLAASLDRLRRRAEKFPPRRVFFCIGRTPGALSSLTTIGPGTFISELLTLAGGQNIFADVSQDYPQISKESLLKRQPDIIIEVHLGPALTDEQSRALRDDWQLLPDLPAVRDNRIYLPQEEFLLIPGPRLAQAANLLIEMIHPEDHP